MSSKTEAVQHAIEGRNIHAPVRDRQSAEVRERSNLVAARVQLFPGFRVKRVEDRVRGSFNSQRAEVGKTLIGISLPGIFTVSIGEDYAIGNHWRLSLIHVARYPRMRQLELAVFHFDLECHDA